MTRFSFDEAGNRNLVQAPDGVTICTWDSEDRLLGIRCSGLAGDRPKVERQAMRSCTTLTSALLLAAGTVLAAGGHEVPPVLLNPADGAEHVVDCVSWLPTGEVYTLHLPEDGRVVMKWRRNGRLLGAQEVYGKTDGCTLFINDNGTLSLAVLTPQNDWAQLALVAGTLRHAKPLEAGRYDFRFQLDNSVDPQQAERVRAILNYGTDLPNVADFGDALSPPAARKEIVAGQNVWAQSWAGDRISWSSDLSVLAWVERIDTAATILTRAPGGHYVERRFSELELFGKRKGNDPLERWTLASLEVTPTRVYLGFRCGPWEKPEYAVVELRLSGRCWRRTSVTRGLLARRLGAR